MWACLLLLLPACDVKAPAPDVAPVDADGDGYDADVDCDDADPRTFPGAVEQCDYADRDCDGDVMPADGCEGVMPEIADVAWAAWRGNPEAGGLGYDVHAAGDLDGDGRGEPVAMCTTCDDETGVQVGGWYVFESPVRPVLGEGYVDRVAASFDGMGYEEGGIAGAGDFDGDGARDLAYVGLDDGLEGWVALQYGPMDASWPMGGRVEDSAGAWWGSASSDGRFGGQGYSDVAPDMDGDGLPEVVVGRSASVDRDGGFHAEVYLFPSGDRRGVDGDDVTRLLAVQDAADSELGGVLSAGDFDGDGLGDLLITRRGADARSTHDVLDGATVAAGIGVVAPDDAALATWAALNRPGFYDCQAALGDVDGDGYGDLAIGDGGANGAPGVWYLAGRAVGQDSAVVAEDATGEVVDSEAGVIDAVGRCDGGEDVDGDGHLDLVAAGPREAGEDGAGGRQVFWLLSGRDGLPSGAVDWPEQAFALAGHVWSDEGDSALQPPALSVGDLDGDGIADVLIGDYRNGGAVYAVLGWEIERGR